MVEAQFGGKAREGGTWHCVLVLLPGAGFCLTATLCGA